MKNKIPYTSGGGTKPYDTPFNIRFKKDLDKYGIKKGDENKAYIVKMVKLDGIMIYPPYGLKEFYINAKSEDDVIDMIEFVDMPEYNQPDNLLPPAIESGTDVILPY
jgi:hypothetical protein